LRDHRISADGVIVIKAQQFRSQEKNKAAALERLADLVRAALVVRKPRKATKPSRSSQAKRLDRKTKHGLLKRNRRAVDD
jgi:ribosome-associated protein